MSEQQHASTLGQFSWALFEWARNPYYILIVIYIFGPYFSTHVIGDPSAARRSGATSTALPAR